MVLGKITWWSMPVSSSTSSRTFGSYAPTCTSSVVHVCRTCASSDFVPSLPMTAPAANMPIGVLSKTQCVWPSITSTCGTRSLYFSGARDVNMSAGSDQWESASTTSMFSVAMIGTVTLENLIYNTANRARAAYVSATCQPASASVAPETCQLRSPIEISYDAARGTFSTTKENTGDDPRTPGADQVQPVTTPVTVL